MHNVEKSAFQKGQYVGYGGGAVWHIRNYGKGNWKATPQGNNKHQVFSCATLRDVSTQLETLSAKPMDANLTTTHKANPAPRKRAAIRATKNATVNVYEMYGTRGEYAADILYRGKLLKQFAGMDLAAIFRQVETWCTNQGYAIRLNDETRRKNPAPRKRAISRPSQVTKKAPTKRLVARRKAAAKKPVKGYFPNPRKKRDSYAEFAPVEIQINTGAGWILYAAACDGESAKKLAKDLATLPKFKNVAIRVMG